MNVLIVDDSNDKVANIIKLIRSEDSDAAIEIVVDFIGAQKALASNQYELLILDLNLPINENDTPLIQNGKNLLLEINRKHSLHSPHFIICLTQYPEEGNYLSDIWKTITYSPDSETWKSPIISLVRHIRKCFQFPPTGKVPKPTIFVEGKTDHLILKESISLFRPELQDQIDIRYETGVGGATWVSRQIIAWAHSLRKINGELIPAIGILDGDLAGKQAFDEINRVIRNDGAESRTFKIFVLNASYARHIIPIKKKGLDLPITLEEMCSQEIWGFAQKSGWLEVRSNAESLLANPIKWNKYELSLKDYIGSLGLDQNESMYLHSVRRENKEDFARHILSQSHENKASALICFQNLVIDLHQFINRHSGH